MPPTPGEIVLFTFANERSDELHGNSEYGQTRTVPAIVTEVFPQPDAPPLLNLQVFTDGNRGVRWETSIARKDHAGGASYWERRAS